MVQYITAFGRTCNLLSVFWQLTGEICFIEVPENDYNRLWVLSFCVCHLISQLLQRSHTWMYTYENERGKFQRWVETELLMKSTSDLDSKSSSMLLHLYSTFHLCRNVPLPCDFPLIMRHDPLWNENSSEFWFWSLRNLRMWWLNWRSQWL